MLTALVPGSMLLLATANMLAGVVQKIFRLDVEKNKSGNLSRYMVPVVALVSLYFIFNGNDTLVAIMLLGVNIIAQFFPALIFSFAKESNHDCGRFFGDYGRCHYFGGHLCLSYFNSRYFPVHY